MKIAFLDLSTRLGTIDDLKVRARGGMITSLFRVSDYLSRQGHDVTVIAGIEAEGTTQDGVTWRKGYDGVQYDVLILNRGIGDGYPYIRARHRVLWTHDLPHDGFAPDPRNLRALSATVFMSRYGEGVWRTFYRTVGRGVLIPNGVDRDLFRPGVERDWHRIIFASAPNRGLKRVPLIFEGIRAKVPTARMDVYSNLQILHPAERPREPRDEEKDGWGGYDKARDGTEVADPEGMTTLDPIPQVRFAEELGNCGLMLVPTDYPEICCNAYLQALACGVPVITTGGVGSAGEWIRHGWNGMFTQFQPVDYMVYFLEMARNAIAVLSDSKLHRKMSAHATKTPGIYSWEEVGSRWDRTLRDL